jgi:PPOX class probable F420-dependent enzyme
VTDVPTPFDDRLRALLAAPNIAHVATLLPDGAPHVVPTWIGVEGDAVVFLTGPRSQKARNLARDPRLSISVADHARPTLAAHVRGHARRRLEGSEAWEVIDRLAQRYMGGPYPRGDERIVFVAAVDHAVVTDFG